tara:strand:- start:119 stop:1075 length:957 start_codon:yes stop_codon:yes gene_type:complete
MGFKYDELDDREKEIYTAIQENPNLNHNALKKYLVETKNVMSKVAFEKAIKRLIEEDVVWTAEDGNKHLYNIPRLPFLTSDENDREELDQIDSIEDTLKAWEVKLHEARLSDKIRIAMTHVNSLRDTRNFLETMWLASYGITDRTDVQKVIRLTIDKLLSKIFKIISDDKDSNRIKMALFANVLHSTRISQSETLNLMEEFFRTCGDGTWERIDVPKMKEWKERYDKVMAIASEEVKQVIFKSIIGELEDEDAIEEIAKITAREAIIKKEKNPSLDLTKLVAELIQNKSFKPDVKTNPELDVAKVLAELKKEKIQKNP